MTDIEFCVRRKAKTDSWRRRGFKRTDPMIYTYGCIRWWRFTAGYGKNEDIADSLDGTECERCKARAR